MFAKLSLAYNGGFLVELQVWPTLIEEIKLKQISYLSLEPYEKQLKRLRLQILLTILKEFCVIEGDSMCLSIWS